MRKELNQIEKAVQYLNGELSSAEALAYTQSMKENPEIERITQAVNLLETAIKRKALRSQIESHASGGSGSLLWILGGLFLIAAGIFIWMQVSTFHGSDSLQKWVKNNQGEQVQQPLESAGVDTPDTTVNSQYSLGGHELWVKPHVQTFRFDSRNGATIEGEQGTLIIVPENGFSNKNGMVLTGIVEFRLVEALDLADMLLYKLQTVSNGNQLESGGMFYIDATVSGQQAEINPLRPLYIEIPTAEVKAGMMGFEGEVVNGKINWINPKPLQKFLVQMPLESLDFLPSGFEEEVERHMPFKNHRIATSNLVDSLYYSLPDHTSISELEAIADTVGFQNDDNSIKSCGIHPHTVETIKHSEFYKSFIATHEFEARIKALHRAPEAESLLQIYIRNLDKNLWEVDAMVAAASTGRTKSQFESFSAQRLTRVEDGELHAAKLSAYYGKKRSEINTYRENLQEELSRHYLQEIAELKKELRDLEERNRLFSSAPALNPASGMVYATPWFQMGWGNIDRYFDFLENGTRNVEILVTNPFGNVEISQWLGEINTYTYLAKNDGKYNAVFPEKTGKNTDTWVFALSGKAPEFQWAFQKYNPNDVKLVELSMAAVGEETIREDLRLVGERFGRIQAERAAQQQFRERMISMQLVSWERSAKLSRQREMILDKLSEAKRRQKAIEFMMGRLMEVGYPCGVKPPEENSRKSDISAQSSTFVIVEEMPRFAGGENAMIRYIQSNLKYPRSAVEAKKEGVVFVTFVVETDGTLRDHRVIRGIDPACDAAALEVVKKMPKWIPGRQRNRAVAVQYNLPVRFELQ